MTAPTTDRHTRSHSQLNDYLHCSHAYYLKRMRKVQEAPSVWLAGGKAFHSATEMFDEHVEAGVGFTALVQENDPILDVDQWRDVFDDCYGHELDAIRETDPDESTWRAAGRKTKDKPNGEDVAWWRLAGRDMIARYINWRISTHDVLVMATVKGRPGIEVEVTTPIGGVPMRGYVDRVMVDASGNHIVIDLKSGSRTPVSLMQLALYSVQLEALMGVPVSWGAYYDARKGTLGEPADLTRFTPQNLGAVYKNLDRAVDSGIFLPRIDSHCNACSVRRACVYQGGIAP